MPCRSDYMNPTTLELSISRVACLLDELSGIPLDINHRNWDGFHPKVYGKFSKSLADSLVAELCAKLKSVDSTKFSLEMQIWDRDHKLADKLAGR